MIYAIILFLSWQTFAGNRSDQVIQFSSPQRSYRISLTSNSLSYQGGPNPFSLEITDCNRKMVQDFWEKAVKDIRKLPPIASKNVPLQPRMKLNENLFWLSPMTSISSKVRDLNLSFIHLAIEEHSKCKKP